MATVKLEDLVQQINKIVRFPKSSPAKAEFCLNICIAALGIRAGYLIDSFSPPEGEVSVKKLLASLRKASSCFEDLRIVCTLEHQQFFFVNIALLRRRAQTLESSNHMHAGKATGDNSRGSWDTIFVRLGRTEELIPAPPQVCQTLKQIAESSEDAILLPGGLTAKTLVPLSGFLLEYPVAYVPSSEDSIGFLSGVPLDVYECTLVFTAEHKARQAKEEHVLVKFSCVAHLAASSKLLEPSKLKIRLQRLFRERLKKTSCSQTLKITHTTITQDRVAL